MREKKTLMLLGGSQSQLAAIRMADDLGYRTVLCDYLPDNPGRLLVDVFYQVSTTEKDAVFEVARNELIDGIVAYGSDPAAPTAAYVAEQLGLPGVPYETARSFCDKRLFREFLEERGFNVPRSTRLSSSSQLEEVESFKLPLIVKPVDSSGSKGVTVVRNPGAIRNALETAIEKSRCGDAIVEEFIERDHEHVIEAEIFVMEGEVVSWGLMNSIRDTASNPLLPAGYTLPLQLNEERATLVRDEVSRLVSFTGVRDGAFNIEMLIDKTGRLFFLDAGPRNGGNMLSEFIGMASGNNLVSATLRAAMGELNGADLAFDGVSGGCWGLSVLHSSETGTFSGVKYSDTAKRALRREVLNAEAGDVVHPFVECTDLVGLAFFEFENAAQMNQVMVDDPCAIRVELV